MLGNWVEAGNERFGLVWPGKAQCIRIIQQPSAATLKLDRSESVDSESTGNVFIEGDNLEVLKLLQKSYFGKIKMIYIDPPYNTGQEFIYPDKYAESLETYLAYTGQVDSEGRRFSTNTDTVGRYHSNWLNMMYPRLYLARNLLQDQGAIFISIDDHELSRLRELCDQIFGEENFKANIAWQKRYTRSNNTVDFTTVVEHILVYAKSEAFEVNLLPRTEEADARYSNPDNDPRGEWKGCVVPEPCFATGPAQSLLSTQESEHGRNRSPDDQRLETFQESIRRTPCRQPPVLGTGRQGVQSLDKDVSLRSAQPHPDQLLGTRLRRAHGRRHEGP